jgi:hypothetical protein
MGNPEISTHLWVKGSDLAAHLDPEQQRRRARPLAALAQELHLVVVVSAVRAWHRGRMRTTGRARLTATWSHPPSAEQRSITAGARDREEPEARVELLQA